MSLLPSLLLFTLLALQLFCIIDFLQAARRCYCWFMLLLYRKDCPSQLSRCEERRTDVMRAVLSGPAEPGFWPSRGRRADGSGEEQPPPFWAHRGRQLAQQPCVDSLLPPPSAQQVQQDLAKYLFLQRDEEPSWPGAARKRSADH